MTTQLGETKFTRKLKGPTTVTLSLSDVYHESIVMDSSPTLSNDSRMWKRKKYLISGKLRGRNYVKSINRMIFGNIVIF